MSLPYWCAKNDRIELGKKLAIARAKKRMLAGVDAENCRVEIEGRPTWISASARLYVFSKRKHGMASDAQRIRKERPV